jgi:Transcription factor WhiB
VVRVQCLEYALAVGETHGIWGGLNELERRRLARRRAAEVSASTDRVASA